MSQPTKASPQMQALYDATMIPARKVIYGDPLKPNDHQRFDMLIEKLKKAGAEVGAVIGQTAALILFNVNGAFTKKGEPVPQEILLAAGRELIADILTIAQKAGVIPEGKQTAIEQQAIQAALASWKHMQTPPTQPKAPPAQQPAAQPQGVIDRASATPPQGAPA